MLNQRDYYCNNKFKYLKIDPEQNVTYNCHAAQPHRVDLTWLEKNPGELFNTELNMSERVMMLHNERNSSCEQNCWKAEDRGAAGTRIVEKGYERTHFSVHTRPEIIDLVIGNDCNLTCSYCCREYSSSWRRDLIDNGDYLNLEENNSRYQSTPMDRILQNLSQTDRIDSKRYQLYIRELGIIANDAKKMVITGGEPFLNNFLFDILALCKNIPYIRLFTGFGVNTARFERIAKQLCDYPNVVIGLSVENVGPLHEFNRYGTKWDDVKRKIELLESLGIKIEVHSTLSNLTLFGLHDFYKEFERLNFEFDFVYNPTFMPVYVLDPDSKQKIQNQLSTLNIRDVDKICQSIEPEPTVMQQKQLSEFLTEYVKRRPDLNMSVFPKSFRDWLNVV